MLKIIFMIVVGLNALFSWELIEVSKDLKTGKIDKNIQKGITGILIKKLNSDLNPIISYVEATGENNVKFYSFENLKQESLPTYDLKPEIGDKIRFFENYDRALIIAKNFNSYLDIKKSFQQEWVHPDIFAATLSSRGHISPLKRDFIYICKEHFIGLLYFQIDDEVKIVDCLSMTQIKSQKITFSKDLTVKVPFYHRLKEIDTNWFGEGSEEFENFNDYYNHLFVK
jgi:hypothetical protein